MRAGEAGSAAIQLAACHFMPVQDYAILDAHQASHLPQAGDPCQRRSSGRRASSSPRPGYPPTSSHAASDLPFPRAFAGPPPHRHRVSRSAGSARDPSASADAASFAIGRFSIAPTKAFRLLRLPGDLGAGRRRASRWPRVLDRAFGRPTKGSSGLGAQNAPGLRGWQPPPSPANFRWRASISPIPTCPCASRSKPSRRSSRTNPTIPACPSRFCAIASPTSATAPAKVSSPGPSKTPPGKRRPTIRASTSIAPPRHSMGYSWQARSAADGA